MRERRYGVDAKYRSLSPPPSSLPPKLGYWDPEFSRRRHQIEEERYSRENEKSRRREYDSGSFDMVTLGEYNRRFYDKFESDRDDQLRRSADFRYGRLDSSKKNWPLYEGDKYRDADEGGRVRRLHYGDVLLRKDMNRYNRYADEDGDGHRDAHPQSRRLSRYGESVLNGKFTSVKLDEDNLPYNPRKLSSNAGFGSKVFTDNYGKTSSRAYSDSHSHHSRSMPDKPTSVESERGKNYDLYHWVDNVSRSFGRDNISGSAPVGGNFSIPLGNLRSSHCMDEGMHFRDYPQLDKLIADDPLVRELYKEEENQFLHRKDASENVGSPSFPRDYVPTSSSLKELSPVLRKTFQCSSNVSQCRTMSADHDVYGERLLTKSPLHSEMQVKDIRSFSRPNHSPFKGIYGVYTPSEVHKSDLVTTSEEFYGRTDRYNGKYSQRETTGLDPITDEAFGVFDRESAGVGNLHNLNLSSKVAANCSIPMDLDAEPLSYGRSEVEYKGEKYHNQVNPYSKEYYDLMKEGAFWPDKKLETVTASEYDSCMDDIVGVSQQNLTVGSLGSYESYNKITKQKSFLRSLSGRYSHGTKTSVLANRVHKVHLPKKSRFTLTIDGKVGRNFLEDSSLGISESVSKRLSVSTPRHLHQPHISDGRDLKQRLGPIPQNIRDKNSKLSVKRRLGPVLKASHATLPWVKSQFSSKRNKSQDCSGRDLINERENTLEGNVNSLEIEQSESENSEDFKQKLNGAFLKFVKKLNENPSLRRRLSEPGKAGGLKCSVCGSDSEVFIGAESLAVHAFTSPKVGYRSHHLGFHKALCLLMGWESSVAPDGSWVHQTLSDAETKSLKEDLIVWPPIVIIHNASLTRNNPEERVIVSIGNLEVILRDMGFGERAKVRRGEPGNQSVMLVTFNGTFSGLQEAQRLDKFYTDKNHGRVDFLQINLTNMSCNTVSEEIQKVSLSNMNHILYGYLAVAEDLDKLDFETKKRCLVKSKKELQDIAYSLAENAT